MFLIHFITIIFLLNFGVVSFSFTVFPRKNQLGAVSRTAVQRSKYNVGLFFRCVNSAALYASFISEQVSVSILRYLQLQPQFQLRIHGFQ